MKIGNQEQAFTLQDEMNFARRKEVSKAIPGFVACTVVHSWRKSTTEITVWVRGEAYGLKGNYRLDWSVEDPAQEQQWDDETLVSIWEQMGEQMRLDAKDHLDRQRNGRYTGDDDNFGGLNE